MRNSDPWGAGEAHQRCCAYVCRLEDTVLRRGRDLLTIWDSFNSPVNPLRTIGGLDGKAVSINLMMSACLHEAILIVCAALDGRRKTDKRPLKQSNLRSLPVVGELMLEAGVQTADLSIDQQAVAARGRKRFLEGVSALDDGPYAERLARLRAFRDDYLAHALDQPWSREPPMLHDVHALMDEACRLSEDGQLALFGSRVDWREGLVSTRDSVDAIWRVLARASV